MPITLNRKNVTDIAKAFIAPGSGKMSYLQRLDVIAQALGLPNQAVMMAKLNAEEAAPAPAGQQDLPPPGQIADALEKCDWSGAPIGHKALLLAAIQTLRAPVPASAVIPRPLDWVPGFCDDGPCFKAREHGDPGKTYVAFDEAGKAWHEDQRRERILAQVMVPEPASEPAPRAPAASGGAISKDEKPWVIVTAFGRDLTGLLDEGEIVDRDEVGGSVVVHEFFTRKELAAYVQGMEDMDGWADCTTVAQFDTDPRRAVGRAFLEALKADPSLDYIDWHNARAAKMAAMDAEDDEDEPGLD